MMRYSGVVDSRKAAVDALGPTGCRLDYALVSRVCLDRSAPESARREKSLLQRDAHDHTMVVT